MYCKFKNPNEHMENLWHLINPNFKAKVSLRVIREMLADLLYISIDQRLKMVNEDENSEKDVREYLEQLVE